MAEDQVLEVLQRLDFTRELEPYQQEKLAGMAQHVSFPADEIIFREGDPGRLVYLIEEGRVAIDVGIPSRGKATILTVGPGELLGWSSLFPGEHKTASGRTVTTTTALAFEAAQLRETMRNDHDLGCALLWRVAGVIAGRLKATRLQLLDIFEPGTGR